MDKTRTHYHFIVILIESCRVGVLCVLIGSAGARFEYYTDLSSRRVL